MAWERNQEEGAKLKAAGFGDFLGDPPNLLPMAEAARHCWLFCGGWSPQTWPIYDALYPVDDWHQLIDLMMELKGMLNGTGNTVD